MSNDLMIVVCLKCGTTFIYHTNPCPHCGNVLFAPYDDKYTQIEFIGVTEY